MNVDLPIKNFPKQQSIFDSKARIKLAAKGRRFGLTKGAANDFILSALEGRFKKGLWVDVVNSNIDKYIERYFLPHLKKLPEDMWNWRVQKKELHIAGAYIDFRSADTPETMEGFGYDKAFINEAGIVLKDEYLWNNAIQPMFWDYKDVSVVIGGTPKGKGKFYELCERGKDPDQPEFEFFTFTSFDNPYINVEAIKEDMKNMPERVVQQEIYARFLDDTGVVFKGFTEIMTAEPNKPIEDHVYVMGVDLARVQDFTVLSVYDTENNKQVYEARFNKLDWAMQRQRIAETSKHYNEAAVVIDATGVGDPIVEELARMEVPVDPIRFTNEQKKQLIEKLAAWIETRQIRMIRTEEKIKEFTNFTYDISERTGKVIYNAPAGFHDDIVISNALAVWRLNAVYRERTEKPKTLIQEHYEKAIRRADEENITIDGYPDELESEWGQF
jgi:hypothetical protein